MEYFSPRDVTLANTIVLAHKASGNSSTLRENTLEAVAYSFDHLDGVEVDIAISKDYGLWLTHDSKVKAIDKYFINVKDEEISDIKDDNGAQYYNRLEEVFKYMIDLNQDKYISLDVKYPFELITTKTFKKVAEKIGALVKEYNLQNKVFIESNSLFFLKEIKRQKQGMGTYFMCWGNYEKGVGEVYQNQLTGISFDYGRDDELVTESVDLAHELGVKVLVYTINDDEIKPVYNLGVDIIETDNIDFYKLLH